MVLEVRHGPDARDARRILAVKDAADGKIAGGPEGEEITAG
jgi:hypothetical protein